MSGLSHSHQAFCTSVTISWTSYSPCKEKTGILPTLFSTTTSFSPPLTSSVAQYPEVFGAFQSFRDKSVWRSDSPAHGMTQKYLTRWHLWQVPVSLLCYWRTARMSILYLHLLWWSLSPSPFGPAVTSTWWTPIPTMKSRHQDEDPIRSKTYSLNYMCKSSPLYDF